MKLTSLNLTNFRNIKKISMEPCDGINVFYGDNAQGKTNLIEAIWLFTGNPSFRGARARELINFDLDEAKLIIKFCDRQREQKAELLIGKKRKIKLNSVELKSLSELNGNFYAVVFSPSHLSLITGGPKERRDFIDMAVSQISPKYEDYLRNYEKLIEQRNALLKNSFKYSNLEENFEIWDNQIAKIGTIITIYRLDYVKKLKVLAKKYYNGMASEKENFSVAYASTVFEEEEDISSYKDEIIETYKSKLKETFVVDLKQGFTSVGIHRDDIEVLINEKSARLYGSQGQQRSSVVSIKLAEAQLIKKVTDENPVMLLDDVMSELDLSRQDYILNSLKDVQVFITCCDVGNTLKLKEGRIFEIRKGELFESINKKEVEESQAREQEN